MDSNKIVQSFWYSKDEGCNYLSSIELLCIASYLAHGHEFHLYTYTPNDASMHFLQEQLKECKNYENFVLKNACEILPKSEIFFDDRGSVGIAAFSDYFRFQLLYQKGGWWVDMDTVCLKYLDIKNPYVFASERLEFSNTKEMTTTCMIKAPKESKFLESILQEAQKRIALELMSEKTLFYYPPSSLWNIVRNYFIHNLLPRSLALSLFGIEQKRGRVQWGIIGPKFLHQILESRSEFQEYRCPAHYFCDIDWFSAKDFILKNHFSSPASEIYVSHVWNAMWEMYGLKKDVRYPKECLIEQLKARYLPHSFLDHLPLCDEKTLQDLRSGGGGGDDLSFSHRCLKYIKSIGK